MVVWLLLTTVISIVILLAWVLYTKTSGRFVILAAAAAILLCSIYAARFVTRIRVTPPPQAISETVETSDSLGELTIRSFRMPAPDYSSGEGKTESLHTSTLTVDVVNDSAQEAFLGLYYQANGGMIGKYSPGMLAITLIRPVPANWAGEIEFPLRHTRFVGGGYFDFAFARCPSANPVKNFLPEDSEIFLEKKCNMVAIPGSNASGN